MVERFSLSLQMIEQIFLAIFVIILFLLITSRLDICLCFFVVL